MSSRPLIPSYVPFGIRRFNSLSAVPRIFWLRHHSRLVLGMFVNDLCCIQLSATCQYPSRVYLRVNCTHRLSLWFQVEQYSALRCYSLFPTYPHTGSRLSPFSALSALLHHPLGQKTTIVRFFPAGSEFFSAGTMTSADFLQLSHTSLRGSPDVMGLPMSFEALQDLPR